MMNASEATLTMVLLFALRCLVPLAIIFGIGYAMNWFVDRWEAEAAAENTVIQDTAVPAQTSGRCWAFKKCDPKLREECPGFTQQMIPCWLARTRAEGALPEECIACPLYTQTPSFA